MSGFQDAALQLFSRDFGPLSPGDQGLAAVANGEHAGSLNGVSMSQETVKEALTTALPGPCLNVVPLLAQEGVS